MKEEYHKWYSYHLNREFEMLVFGHSGHPIILFPTSHGRYYENKDHGLIASAAHLIELGKIKIYCPDGVDSDSWYNFSIHPADRVKTHIAYETLIINDVISYACHETGFDKVALAGCSFGGYHAANLAFKHPGLVDTVITMGGTFDLKEFIWGHYNDDFYFNNPLDYLTGLNDSFYLDEIKKMKIVFGIGTDDYYLGENRFISDILKGKGIDARLDVVPGEAHDWSEWKEMFPRYLSEIFGEQG